MTTLQQVLGNRKLIRNVMNVVRYMIRLSSTIITFNADIAEEPDILNEYGDYKFIVSDANSPVIVSGATDIDVVR